MFNQTLFENAFAKLISFPTISGESNLALIDYVQNFLKQYDIPCYFSGDNQAHQKNCYAIIGPQEKGGVLLSGHTDVVGTEGQVWQSDPFTLRLANQKYYGRGTCDMKGFLALILSMAPHWQQKKLKKPVCLSFTYDEETNYAGVQSLVREFTQNLSKPDRAIVGEPSELRVIVGHKGESYLDCYLTGLAAHSSRPDTGLSTIYYAAKLISEIEKVYQQNKTLLKKDERFNPSHSSLSIGLIRGGNSVNTVPDSCQFSWEIRTIFGEDLDNILKRVERAIALLQSQMQAQHKQAGIELKKHYTAPPLEYHESSAILALIKKHLQFKSNLAVDEDFASFGTEAGYFQKAGIDSIVWGPGSISQAHQRDEFIELSQIEQYSQVLDHVISDYCA